MKEGREKRRSISANAKEKSKKGGNVVLREKLSTVVFVMYSDDFPFKTACFTSKILL